METTTWLFSILVFFVPFFGLMVAILILAIRREGGTKWPVVIGFSWAVVLLLIVFIAGFGFHWGQSLTEQATPHPNDPTTHQPEFGEGYQPQAGYEAGTIGPSQLNDPIAQPQSVLSDMAFMAAGLFILYLFSAPRTGVPANPMVDARSWNPFESGSWYPMFLGLLVIAMGPASMVYHATITEWGGWFDAMSIIVWMLFSLCYSVQQLIRWRWTWIFFLLVFGGLVVLMGYVATTPGFDSLPAYLGFGATWGVLDLIVVICAARNTPIHGVVRSWQWYAAMLGLFTVSMVFFWIFCGGGPSTALSAPPYSLYQAHAWYHSLSGGVTLLGYLYFASETGPEPSARVALQPAPVMSES